MEESKYRLQAAEIIRSARLSSLSIDERREQAIELASLMMSEARRIQTHAELKVQNMLAAMMEDPLGKVFTTTMTDQCFRSERPARIANQLNYLIHLYGVPNFLPILHRCGLYLFKYLGERFSSFFVPMIRYFIRKECARVILPAESAPFLRHLKKRRKEQVRINVNHLGEAILGNQEAEKRLQIYLQDLRSVQIECISIKISTLFSQINLLAFDQTLECLAKSLRRLYREARDHFYIDFNGEKKSKFVNLDMEEYRDMHLSVALFKTVLGEPEFFHYSAGIVLQSYLPDSYLIQQELTLWALQRVACGGAPIKIRLVKGANLAMEQVESSLHGWAQTPYPHKTEVDANFKRMMHYGFKHEHASCVHLGIGSHNLFDIAYALLLRSEHGLEKEVDFEMLEGMGEHLRHVVQMLSGGLLLYCPVAKKDEFQTAIAYLIRRLDENTASDHFLRHAFDLIPNTREWNQQATLFSISCHAANSVSYKPRRYQNRLIAPEKLAPSMPFKNEPDTDWALECNGKWGRMILQEGKAKTHPPIPLVIGGSESLQSVQPGISPSDPSNVLYQCSQAGEEEIESALRYAEKAQKLWEVKSMDERFALFANIAHQLRAQRGYLIMTMVADGGKTVVEADAEVSEAIDFLEFYRSSYAEIHSHPDVKWSAKGIVVVASPWNFPVAIPCGGIAAALASGNSVIFKPAPEVALAAYALAQCFWNAGVSRSLLQFICCQDVPYAQMLVTDHRVAAVILTGSAATAKYLLNVYPSMHLLAETGGKNAIIITSMADRDQAVRHLVDSAFGHAGQKCSAASLAILEEELYDDAAFLEKIKDAVGSLVVGSVWDPITKVGPLINPAAGLLEKALNHLDEGEEWLVKPLQDLKNPHLWSPGVKLGVKEGSFSHVTEFFGPVLSLMKASDLEEALRLANGTPYGLTAGLESLDAREQKIWEEKMIAGNLYINRTITGAIVGRQPFGGAKYSSFGSHAKAGGMHYLTQLMNPKQLASPLKQDNISGPVAYFSHHLEKHLERSLLQSWQAAIGSYAYWWNTHYSQRHDPMRLKGENNECYYQPYSKIILKLSGQEGLYEAICVGAAAITAGVPLEISTTDLKCKALPSIPNLTIHVEEEAAFIERLRDFKPSFNTMMRLLSTPSSSLIKKIREIEMPLTIAPALANGRFELHHCVREISLSCSYHRYGNVGLIKEERHG